MTRKTKVSAAEEHGIRKLSDRNHVRLRLEMYAGSRTLHTQMVLLFDEQNKLILKEMTWVPSVLTCVRELLDNSLDETLGHGFGNRIDFTYNPDTFEISVEDNGRGIPIDYDKEHKCHLATLVLSETRAGRNFGDRTEIETVGQNGIGAAMTNFVSEYFNLEIHRDQQIFKQQFTEAPIGFEDALQIGDPIIKETTSKKTGTKISFKLSERVFPNLVLPEEFIKSRIIEIAICNPQLHVYYNGEIIKVKPRPEQNLFHDTKPITLEIREEGFKSTFYLSPNWLNEGGEHVHAIVNNIPTFNGGVHIETFKRLFYSGLLTALEKESKKRKLSPNRADISEGMLIYNITNMTNPMFDSQSKTRLINENVGMHIKKHFENEEVYKEIIKKNSEWIDQIYERCEERTLKKDAADVSKLAKKNLRTKVPGLMDANGVNRSDCIIILAEGLCMDEQTNIHVLEDGVITNKTAKNIEIGDVVLTHKHNFKYVTEKTTKVSKGTKIKTKYGEEIFSQEHKLLAFDKKSQKFIFVAICELDKNNHQLVRSKIVDFNNIMKIHYNEKIVDEKFDRIIKFGDNVQYCTNTHKYAVFDLINASYHMIEAQNINPEFHAMVFKI